MGRDVGMGDSLEVQMTGWTVENQSIGQMVENTRNKEKGFWFKLGGKSFFSGLESGIVGMKKGGRRFLIVVSENGMKAYDVEVIKLKPAEAEKKADTNILKKASGNVEPEELAERMSRLGQSMIPNNKTQHRLPRH